MWWKVVAAAVKTTSDLKAADETQKALKKYQESATEGFSKALGYSEDIGKLSKYGDPFVKEGLTALDDLYKSGSFEELSDEAIYEGEAGERSMRRMARAKGKTRSTEYGRDLMSMYQDVYGREFERDISKQSTALGLAQSTAAGGVQGTAEMNALMSQYASLAGEYIGSARGLPHQFVAESNRAMSDTASMFL
jgi:hypothetical protein